MGLVTLGDETSLLLSQQSQASSTSTPSKEHLKGTQFSEEALNQSPQSAQFLPNSSSAPLCLSLESETTKHLPVSRVEEARLLPVV